MFICFKKWSTFLIWGNQIWELAQVAQTLCDEILFLEFSKNRNLILEKMSSKNRLIKFKICFSKKRFLF